MIVIKKISAKIILDSRKEKTIEVSIKTNAGNFSASSPTGKSTGKFAKKIYIKSIEQDIKKLQEMSEYFSEENFEIFSDLKKIEEICEKQVGANTIFALESAVLKSIAREQKKQVWELINPKAKKIPVLIQNIIGGGKHSDISEKNKGPDFQEFLIISKNYEKNKKAYEEAKIILKKLDEKFKSEKNDENAWKTSLNEKLVLDVLTEIKQKFGVEIGIDIAASSFYKRKKYHYLNPKLDRDSEEQSGYIFNLVKNLNLFYIEDCFHEEDFENFAKLRKKFPEKLIVGDDLTVTNLKRFEKAIEKKSISGIIVKPNQVGSLIEVAKVCDLAKKNKIKIIFSHRSGETEENILADLAFGFEGDFLKIGIIGKERESKIKRLREVLKKR